jgi:hypothetical protein
VVPKVWLCTRTIDPKRTQRVLELENCLWRSQAYRVRSMKIRYFVPVANVESDT